MALLAIAVWLVQPPYLQALALLFAGYSAGFTVLLPTHLRWQSTSVWRWLAALVAAACAALAEWAGVSLAVVVMVLALVSLLRLWYLRQYHWRRQRQQLVELLRRGLLISLWCHISVSVALVNPY
jgi:uncharacterized membrane protein